MCIRNQLFEHITHFSPFLPKKRNERVKYHGGFFSNIYYLNINLKIFLNIKNKRLLYYYIAFVRKFLENPPTEDTPSIVPSPTSGQSDSKPTTNQSLENLASVKKLA